MGFILLILMGGGHRDLGTSPVCPEFGSFKRIWVQILVCAGEWC